MRTTGIYGGVAGKRRKGKTPKEENVEEK